MWLSQQQQQQQQQPQQQSNSMMAVSHMEGSQESYGIAGCSRITAPFDRATAMGIHSPFDNKTFPTLTCCNSPNLSHPQSELVEVLCEGNHPHDKELQIVLSSTFHTEGPSR